MAVMGSPVGPKCILLTYMDPLGMHPQHADGVMLSGDTRLLSINIGNRSLGKAHNSNPTTTRCNLIIIP